VDRQIQDRLFVLSPSSCKACWQKLTVACYTVLRAVGNGKF